jgi:cation diffusion facilitator family transporter
LTYNAEVSGTKVWTPEAARQSIFAMRLSLAFGFLMLLGKAGAWYLTGSSAILSDAAESIVHVAAVSFAYFSLHLSLKPADERFLYGYERISYFSAGFEGGMIILAAITIIAVAVKEWAEGIHITHLGPGTAVVACAAAINAALGGYLVHVGRKHNAIILEANGKHVLTDFYTSAGVIVGLGLVLVTGWLPFDPICAIVVAVNILWSGGNLVRRSFVGLMDYADPETGREIRRKLDDVCRNMQLQYHGLRFRNTGRTLRLELHLLFPSGETVESAHRKATQLEEKLATLLDGPVQVVTHIEALEDHGEIHPEDHDTGRPG